MAGFFQRALSPVSIAIVALGITVFTAPKAHAGVFYYEFAGGYSQLTDQGFFSSAGSTSSGAGLNNGLYYAFGNGGGGFEFQLGLADRMIFASGGTSSISYLGIFPSLRLQFSRLYFGAGFTPVVLSGFAPVTGGKGYYVDAGLLLWSVTPKFTIGVNAGMQGLSGPGSATAIDGALLFRFYWNFIKSERKSSEFHGWRYPFGRELH